MYKLIHRPFGTLTALGCSGIVLSMCLVVVGCSKDAAEHAPPKEKGTSTSTSQSEHSTGPHDEHGTHSAHDEHAGHANMMARRRLTVSTEPAKPNAGTPTKLTLQIQDDDGTPVERFEVAHEKLVHLIVVRDGLDEFAHLHPEVDDVGRMTQEYTFPKGGQFRLFADHKPHGKPAGVAVGELVVEGKSEPAPALVPNTPGEMTAGDIKAQIDIAANKEESVVRFRLTDSAGHPIEDLEPYLGAMGHFVIISSDGREYIHAHPIGDATSAPDGAVEFAAHFSMPGIYKAWGQFQRDGSVFTVPFVMEHKPTASHKGKE